MFENLDVFKMSSAMAKHAGSRQALISQNVANADTPGYSARDLMSFKSTFETTNTAVQKATRSSHLNGLTKERDLIPIEENMAASPDGNSVSIEGEMLKATETIRQHDRALAVYKSALGILRSSLGRR